MIFNNVSSFIGISPKKLKLCYSDSFINYFLFIPNLSQSDRECQHYEDKLIIK